MDASKTREGALPGWARGILQAVIVIALPLLLVLINARLLMSDAYLRWEYNRPSFPPDPYGFTREDRLTYAPPALAYLFNNEGIDFLGSQTFPDGSPLYNARELSHMDDVKAVTRGLTHFGLGLLGVFALCTIVLAAAPGARRSLYRALFQGSVLTVGLIIAGLVAVATAFNWLFTQFHALFFEGDSWLFLTSDTLIRLFPERFWIDAFALLFGAVLVEALILGLLMWLKLRR
jgi:integral membrane protein (TIGR01906 family)